MKKYTWPSALILALVLSVSACSKPSAEEQLQKAQAHLKQGDKKAAIIEFKNLLAEYPDNAEARRQLGQLYLESGETDAALIELKKAVEHGADKVTTATALARALLAKGDHLKTLEYLDPKKLPEADTAPALIVLRGHALAMRRMFDDAGSQYRAALKIDPKYADASIGLARIAVMQGQTPQALALLDEVLSHSPANADALLMKGDMLRRSGDKAKATELYQQALAADKSKDQAYLNLIAMAVESGQMAQARTYLGDLQKMSPNNIFARHLEAVILLREKQPDQALAKALEVLKLAPALPATNLLAANIEYSKGMYQQAIAHLNAVLANSPNNLPAQRLMVATLLKQNEIDKASGLLAKLTEQFPDDAALLSLAGEVAARQKDFAKAMTIYSRAAQLNPQNAELRTRLAMSKMATGDSDKALLELENIAATDDKATQADIVLALAHINKREWKQAEAVVARLAGKQPDSPLPGSLQASILLGKNDPAGARKALDGVLSKHPEFVPAAVNLARLDLQEKKPEQAQKRFESLLAKDNKNARLMLAYAEFLMAINKPQEAQTWLEKARQAQPEAVEPSLALTSLALRNKDYKRALSVAQDALAKKPDNPLLLDNLATAQLAAGEQNQALATLAKLTKAMPNSPMAYLKLANAQMLSANNPGAIESLQKAIALAPNAVDARIMLGRLYLKMGQATEGLRISRALQSSQPKSAAGYLLEGDIHLQSKAYGEAAATYMRANNVQPTQNGVTARYNALILDGKSAQADVEIAKWLASNTKDSFVRQYVAERALRDKDYSKAIYHYESLNLSQPNNPIVLNNLAYCYLQVNSPKALPTAELALKYDPNNTAVMDTYADILLLKGEHKKASVILERAVALDPSNQDISFTLARSYALLGEKDKARKLVESLLASGKKFEREADASALLNKLK
jgi:putative PEP-CTERM system TPR-repeat lipoprotein